MKKDSNAVVGNKDQAFLDSLGVKPNVTGKMGPAKANEVATVSYWTSRLDRKLAKDVAIAVAGVSHTSTLGQLEKVRKELQKVAVKERTDDQKYVLKVVGQLIASKKA